MITDIPQRAISAWDLTRAISPRSIVRCQAREASGEVTQENQYQRAWPLGAEGPDTPWYIYLADNKRVFRLICWDFDADDSAQGRDDVVDDTERLTAILEAHSIPFVMCESSSSGGRHVWVAVRGGVAADIVASIAEASHILFHTLDHGLLLNPSQGGVRPPLAPHRNGSSSSVLQGSLDTLISPVVTATEIETLQRTLAERIPPIQVSESPQTVPAETTHRTKRPMSRWGAVHMATKQGGEDPSYTAFLCLLAAARAGWSIDDVKREISSAPGLEHYRTKNAGGGKRVPRSSSDASSRLERQWKHAQRICTIRSVLPKSNSAVSLSNLEVMLETIQTIIDRMNSSPGRWLRREKDSHMRSVLLAVAYLHIATGKAVVAASVRDVANLTGIGRTSASTALGQLVGEGWLVKVRPHDAANAAEFMLSTSHIKVRTQPLRNAPPYRLFTSRASLLHTLETELSDARHDIFTRAGLGHLCGRLYALLRNAGTLTLKQLQTALGTSDITFATLLSRLHRYKLVVKVGAAFRRSKRDLRNSAARSLGVSDILLRRAENYAKERIVWKWWQAEYGTMSTIPLQRPRRPHLTARELPTFNSPVGERLWPRYPRKADGRADHKKALHYVVSGFLSPGSRWQLVA